MAKPGRKPTPLRGLYSNSARRFIKPNGQYLSDLEVRAVLDADIAGGADRLAALTRDYLGGALSGDAWRVAMAGELKSAHLASVAVAKGGIVNMTQRDYGFAGAALRKQYGFLARFDEHLAQQLRADPTLAGNPAFVAKMERRARAYASAARTTFEAVRFKEARKDGANWARRILHASESCAGCAGVANRWMPIGEMVPIGGFECNVHCRCTIEFAQKSPLVRGAKKNRKVRNTEGRIWQEEELPAYSNGVPGATDSSIMSAKLVREMKAHTQRNSSELGAIIEQRTGRVRQLLEGEPDYVDFSPEILAERGPFVVVHSHNYKGAFSDSDWYSFRAQPSVAIDVVVTPDSIYLLRKTERFNALLLPGDEINARYDEIYDFHEKTDAIQRIKNEKEREKALFEKVNEDLAETMGADFVRIGLSEFGS